MRLTVIIGIAVMALIGVAAWLLPDARATMLGLWALWCLILIAALVTLEYLKQSIEQASELGRMPEADLRQALVDETTEAGILHAGDEHWSAELVEAPPFDKLRDPGLEVRDPGLEVRDPGVEVRDQTASTTATAVLEQPEPEPEPDDDTVVLEELFEPFDKLRDPDPGTDDDTEADEEEEQK
ncbi:hypothetical protein L2X99_13760 [Microbacterium sp. KUDC0406]|uniref:hypothetical protein n=1 Tax=Microbacterium sp. KUDC0406 TaxID=2909588 RepID=UPI001F2F9CA8|nr:hypothetical protein [Microbacterium sp. KUDC0406]UJP09481.1 hypothetical protein L2X99_13760 [Microbacterium sp. KUDC0406]